MPDGPRAKTSRNLLLVFLILLPAAMWLRRAFLAGSVVAGMRAVDVAQIFVLTPICIAVLLYLWNHMQLYGAPRWLGTSFLVLSMVFLYGLAMHSTANAIHAHAAQVTNLGELLPKDLSSLILFLDEGLSLLLLFGAVVGLVACWFVWDQYALAPPLLPGRPLFVVPMGLLYGVTLACTTLEAGTVWIIIAIVLALAGLWLWFWGRSGRSLGAYAGSRPFTGFVAVMLIVAIVATVASRLCSGGFPQPSEVGF